MASKFKLRNLKWAPLIAGFLACITMSPQAMGQLHGFKIPGVNKVPGGDKIQKGVEASKPLTVEEETDIGRDVAAKMIAAFHVYRNDPLTRYVNEVGDTVAAQSERQDIQYHFAVLDSGDVNAFSAPGGYVFVTRGALRLCQNESELAGVLAHEVGHIAAKHVVREIEKANREGAVAGGLGEYASQLTKNVPGSAAYQSAIENLAKGVISMVFEKGLSPKDEYDADARAVRYAHAAGYPADGLEQFLNAFANATAPGGAQSYMTTTHPPVKDRNDRMQQEITQQQWQDADRPQLADRYVTLTAMLRTKAGS